MTRPGLHLEAAPGWSAQEAERWLLSRELFGMRFGLDRMRRLMTALDAPHESFEAIHVVGTNGKSSTVRMIAALLGQHGLRAGAYLSPHLVSFAERIRVDGADISQEQLAAAVGRARRAAELVDRTLDEDDRVTQFEALTAAAYAQLAAAGVDVAVVEAGLGGRWDATNVIDARVVVLTNVGLEHTRWLGPTVRDIAGEKLAVVKRSQPPATLVLGPDLHPEADAEARRVADDRGATIVRAPAEPPAALRGERLLARGAFQRRNFAVACAATQAFLGRLDDEAVRGAAASTAVPGRFDVRAGDGATEVVLDGAHNPGGVAALAESLPPFLAGRPLVAVVSVLDDKDAAAMLAALLPLCAAAVFTANAHPRALSPATLASLAGQVGAPPVIRVEPDPRRAVAVARELAGEPSHAGVVLATGSIYLIADLMRPDGAGRGSTL
ncbi:MAG TPA: cyanophycin synthetase [Solirubrobacteraceae bacterium]|nr:cyanophycin synthetase [Solirubrobacteraceae bacterium]